MATLLDLYNRFLDEKQSYCSEKTVTYYRENIFFFLQFLADQYNLGMSELMPDLLSKDLMVRYLSHLRKRPIKNTSVNTYFRAVKVFNSWLFSENYTEKNFCSRIRTPRSDDSVKMPLTSSEVELLDGCFDMDSFLGTRNYCIFHLMLDCGLRRGEVIRLRRDSFNYDLRVIYVEGKGSRRRVVPMPDFLKWHLLSFYNIYGRLFDTDSFFLTCAGKPLTENSVKMFFSRLSCRSGISRLHPHLLRHTFATSYILGGGNLEFLRLLLGHSDYDITRKYLHLANTALVLRQDIYHLDSVYFQKVY